MALQSELLSGDPKLEAAAVSDPAHVVPGARGEHVRKIQLALIQVNGAALKPDGIYGPATAAAVLAFKQQRNIVNRAIQKTADDIVGKMTIAALDREMLTVESKPALIFSASPPAVPKGAGGGGLRLSFSVGGGPGTVGAPPTAAPVIPTPSPGFTELQPTSHPGQQMILAPQQNGSVHAMTAVGGVLVMSEPPDQNSNSPLAKLLNGTNLRRKPKLENADIVADPELFNYRTGDEVGKVMFQVVVTATKKSGWAELLVLVSTSSYTDEPVHPVDPAFKSNLVSVNGTPLNPLPGRKINIFGRGESNGFENYSSILKFCNDSGNNTKPWTDDPRKTGPGIPNKTVANICIRSSPVNQVTIDEIKRIAAPGCRMTFSGPASDPTFVNKLRTEFVTSGLAKSVEDGAGKFGNTIVFEIK